MVALITFVSGVFGRFITSAVVRYIALKGLLLFLFVFILPAVLLKLWFYIQTYVLSFVSSVLVDNIPGGFFSGGGMVELSGLAAHIAGLLNLSQGISVLISCAFAGWIVKLIRG